MLLSRLFHRNVNGHHAAVKRIAMAAGAAGTAVAARAGLPSLLTQVTNFALQKIPGYRGHLEHIELHLFKGRLALQDLVVNQVIDHHDVPLFRVEAVKVHVAWRHLMKGTLVGDVEIDRPVVLADLSMLKQKQAASPASKPSPQPTSPDSMTWQEKIRHMLPFQVHMTVYHGEVYVRGLPGQDGANVRMRDINLHIRNITNSKELSGTMMAFVECHMRLMSRGYISVQASGYPLALPPTFNVDFKLEDLDMSELKPFVRHFTGLELKQGIVEAYAEAAAKDGQLQGYLKPILDRLDIERGGPGMANAIKGKLAEGAVKLLQSRKEDRIATRIDFEGPIDKPSVDTWSAVGGVIRNAFWKAWTTGLEHKLWFERTGTDASAAQLHYSKPHTSRTRRLFGLIGESFKRWKADSAPRLAAALSYYTAFSIAPLLLLAVSIAGLVFGREAAQGQIVHQLGGLVGPRSAQTIQSMIQAANQPTKGVIASIISVITLLAGATGVLAELKDTLNHIWRTEEPSDVKTLVKTNVKYFGLVFAIGFLLLVSLAASAALAAFGKWMGGLLPLPEFVIHILNLGVSFGIITVLFAAIYKALPNTQIAWRDVWVGSAVTSLLFTIGKFALGLYLGKGTVSSAYGSAGSILIVLMWVYYSGLIFYFGAEFTKVYADQYGSRKHGSLPSAAMKKAA